MKMEYEFIQELEADFIERTSILKKYYPFFKILLDKNRQFKDCKTEIRNYECLDIGYLILSLMRYLVEENNFKNRGVTYLNIYEYMNTLVDYSYRIILKDEECKELTSMILELLTNGGQPYEYVVKDGRSNKFLVHRVSYIRAEVDAVIGNLNYFITDLGIEFYLETKEMKELNRISIQQVLLEKMVSSSNFKGAREIVNRISNEVSKLHLLKKEVIDMILINPVQGDVMYEEFYKKAMEWFDQEEDYFSKNLKAVEYARDKIISGEQTGTIREINWLSDELKNASNKYGDLLIEMVDLKNKVDDIRASRKIKVLRNTFDFNVVVSKMIDMDNADDLKYLAQPFLLTRKNKYFDFKRIDELLRFKALDEDVPDVKEEDELIDYVFDDELELERIKHNHHIYIQCFYHLLQYNINFDLNQYNALLEEKFGPMIFNQGDYFSFLIGLSSRSRYVKDESSEDTSSLWESIVSYEEKTGIFIPFEIGFISGETITLKSGFQTTNIYVRRLEDGSNNTDGHKDSNETNEW